MNNPKNCFSQWQRLFLCLLLTLVTQTLRADFSGDYAPARWTTDFHGGNGGEDWELAPDELDLYSGTTGTGPLATSDATVRVTSSGILSFAWELSGGEGAGYSFSWLSNGVARILAIDSIEEIGSSTFAVQANDVIGFRVTAPKGGDPEWEYSAVYVTAFVGPGQTGQPPTIAEQPISAEACFGADAEFMVEANNASSYQWQFNGQDIEDETYSFLQIADTSSANVGRYRVIVSNPYGSVTSSDVFLTLSNPPTITTQPSSQTVCAGESITLCVGVTGSGPLTYQWSIDGQELFGATKDCFLIPNVQPADAGRYSVLVMNDCGEVSSGEANISVNSPPEIAGQPRAQTRIGGETAMFTLVHSGTVPFNYQWYRNGQPLIGANQASLVIPNVDESNEGEYSVSVSNVCGEQTSQAALLTVEGTLPRLSISQETSNTVDIRLNGPIGREYVLEVSTNLLNASAAWRPVTTNSYCDTQLVWRRTVSGHGAFYRVRVLSELAKVPTRPENLDAEGSATGTAVNLTWQDRSADESGFVVERMHNGSSFSVIGNVGAGILAYTDISASPDGYYSYRVRSRNCAGDSLPSNTSSMCRIAPPIDATAFASPDGLSVTLSWVDHSASEAGFVVERWNDSTEMTQVGSVGQNQTTFVDESVEGDTCYSYRVTAWNNCVRSKAPNDAVACTPAIIAAPGPLRLSTTSLGNVRVEWADNSSNETAFEIERSGDGSNFSLIQTAPPNGDSAARIVDRNVLVGASYFYRARAIREGAASPYSSVEGITLRPASPAGLVGCGAVNVSRWATFNWAAVAGASSYVVEIAADAPSEANVVERRTATVAGATHNIPDNDPLSAIREIYWRVRAQNSAGAGPWSSWCGFTTEAAMAPTGLSPRNQSNVSRTPTFTWNPARGGLSYNFRIAADAPSEANIVERRSTNIITIATHTIPANDPLSPGRDFYWQVQTVDRTETGPWSSWAHFSTINDLPGQVAGLVGCGAVNVSRWATFSWAAVVGATSYVIEIAADAPSAGNVVERRTATVTGTAHNIPDNDPLSASREIYWRVRAQNSAGAGPWSSWCGFTTEAAVAPTGLSPRNQSNVSRTPTFTWNPARGALSYDFRIAADAPSEANIVERRSTNIIVVATHSIPAGDRLSASRTFYWQVQTVDRTETGPWSSWTRFVTGP